MKDFVILENEVLKIKVLHPINSKYYRSRFNHSGFIYDVWYKGVKFSEYERSQPNFPTTEGSGLCCQYDSFKRETRPEKGEKILRPGIGIMEFDPERKGEEITPFDTKFTFNKTEIVFETVTPEIGGFAYMEKRVIALKGEEITETVTLKNIGKNKIVTKEYCHNFLSLGGKDISPDYAMQVYCIEAPDGFSDNDMYFDGDKSEFTFRDFPSKSYYFRTTETKESDIAFKMYDKNGSAFCYEKINFKPSQVAVWGDHYCMCCEVFVPVELEANEEISWQRTWGLGI